MTKAIRAATGLLLTLLLLTSATLMAQQITLTKDLPATPVKNQANSGTCWSFATVSMLESELLRMGKGETDLSEMYFVRLAYLSKAERYYRLMGLTNFSPGGQGHDVFDLWRIAGAMPDEAYTGLPDGEKKHDHSKLDAAMAEVIKANRTIAGRGWTHGLDSVLNLYLGIMPPQFEVKGKTYNPVSYAATLGIDPDDYIEITSYAHHPFYSTFILEVPDNWSSGTYYNVPLDELIRIMENAISTGYTFAWDGDVSGEISFGANEGVAKASNEDHTISQDERQKAFDQFVTTDDHLMHITGLGSDENGRKYFLTKNSWGDGKGNKGYWWLTENFVRMNTICILVNKAAVPSDIAAKLKLR